MNSIWSLSVLSSVLLAILSVPLLAGLKYKIPTVQGRDPAHLKLSPVEYDGIKRGFGHPSEVMKSLVTEYFEISSYDAFLKLPVHSQILVVNKTCDILAVNTDGRVHFLQIHFHYQLTDAFARKVLSYK